MPCRCDRRPSAPLLVALAVALVGSLPAAAEVTVVHAGTLLPVPGEAPLERQSLIIREGRIAELRAGFVDPSAVASEGEAVELIDLSTAFVLPGLIDLHTHLLEELGPERKLGRVTKSDADLALDGAVFARRTLAAGFTTVRNTGARAAAILALRDAIDAGKVPGPRIFASCHGITATGGHGDEHGFRDDVLAVLGDDGVCDGAADCRRAVRAQIKRGADWIKTTATGGVLSETAAGTEQQLFDDELEAIVATAHSLGRKVAAHAHGTGGINAALAAGVDTIEHGTYADEESFELFRERGAWLVPTMLAGATVAEMAASSDFMAPAVREKALRVGPRIAATVAAAHAAGVRIAFGTDSGVSRHGDNAREFVLLVEAGLTPMEAIESATVHAAEVLGIGGRVGTLEPGKAADLIATTGDPLTDIGALLDIGFVMRGGVVYKGP